MLLEKQACEYLDRLISVEIRPSGLLNDITKPLYDAARSVQGGDPLTLIAAQRLRQALLKPGSSVLLSTGIGGPAALPFGETDGPPGLAVLARALLLLFDTRPLVAVEDRYMAATTGVLEAVGLTCAFENDPAADSADVLLFELSFEMEVAARQTQYLLDQFKPQAIVAVERPGPNREGVIHNALGKDWTSPQSHFYLIIEEAQRRGILTLSMGEVGNEIGFGMIESAVRRTVPYADTCQCPCGGGSVSSTGVDVLVVAGGCNWACYGIEAALALLMRRGDIIHDSDLERPLVEACLRGGAVDGVTGRKELLVEGCSIDMSRSLAVLLRGAALNWLQGVGESWLQQDKVGESS